MEFGEILEIVVLCAIALELFALYSHTKLDHRIDEHILEANEGLARNEALMNALNERISRLDEHLIRTDEHVTKLDDNIRELFDEHLRQEQEKNRS